MHKVTCSYQQKIWKFHQSVQNVQPPDMSVRDNLEEP